MERTDSTGNPPIFVIGNPRSGTTLLRLMLTCHPRICIPPESGWLIRLHPKYSKIKLHQQTLQMFLDDLFSTPKIEGWNLDRLTLLRHLEKEGPQDYAALATQVYLFFARNHGKIRWGDKNNYYLHHIDQVAALFPNSVFVHIVRDGRDVACSYRDLARTRGQYAPNLPTSVWGAAHDWARNVKTIQAFFKTLGGERTLTVRYEDLVHEPERTLRTICTFLREEYDSAMLSFAEENRRNQLEPEITIGWKGLTKHPVTSARVARWKREMFDEDRIVFELLAKDILSGYGYELPNSMGVSLSSLFLRLYSFACMLERNARGVVHALRRGLRSFLPERYG